MASLDIVLTEIPIDCREEILSFTRTRVAVYGDRAIVAGPVGRMMYRYKGDLDIYIAFNPKLTSSSQDLEALRMMDKYKEASEVSFDHIIFTIMQNQFVRIVSHGRMPAPIVAAMRKCDVTFDVMNTDNFGYNDITRRIERITCNDEDTQYDNLEEIGHIYSDKLEAVLSTVSGCVQIDYLVWEGGQISEELCQRILSVDLFIIDSERNVSAINAIAQVSEMVRVIIYNSTAAFSVEHSTIEVFPDDDGGYRSSEFISAQRTAETIFYKNREGKYLNFAPADNWSVKVIFTFQECGLENCGFKRYEINDQGYKFSYMKE